MLSHFLILLTLVTSDPTWVIQDAGVTTSIRGISAVSPEICWIGTKAGVARTVDAGKTWKFFKIGGDELDFRDLEAIDENECIAMSAGEGDASRIYRTADGGESWKLVFQNHEAKGFFNGIAFHNEKQGILAGDPIGGRRACICCEWHTRRRGLSRSGLGDEWRQGCPGFLLGRLGEALGGVRDADDRW